MNSSNSVDINGDKIRLIRERKGLTQLYLATVVGVTTDTISRWENRRYPAIKLENAKKLAEALEVSLDELLPEEKAEPDAEGQGERIPETVVTNQGVAAGHTLGSFAAHRMRWIAAAGVLLLIGALIGTVWLANRPGVRAVRIMPRHTAPNLSFPVMILVTGETVANNTLLIREELRGDAEATGSAAEGPKEFGKNPRWIGKLDNGRAAFLYLVTPGKKLRPDEEIGFAGDIISREGQTAGDAIDGAAKLAITPYHWVDSDRDSVISDNEIRKAHETYAVPGENLINFSAIEELWLAGGYAWNKKTQSFVPAPPGTSRE